jgi:uncharacterized membrane protein
MILMAIDHTRDFFGQSGNPTDLTHTTIALFFTRWITHFCAPVFSLLTGVGARLALQRKSRGELSRYLFTRGLWLVFLEAGLFKFLGFQFNFDYRITVLNVLWALGWSMIVLAGLVHLPASWVTAFGLVLIAGHDAFDSVQSSAVIWRILHSSGYIVTGAHSVFLSYPMVPWIGVTAAGYGLGRVYEWTAERRRIFLVRAGMAMTALFVLLRGVNVYGDPSRWHVQKSAAFTVLSFLNTSKYPPSLLYLLMTLGPALVLLGAIEGADFHFLRPALTIGKVPLFYFLVHLPLIHLLAVAVCYARYGDAHWMFESPDLAHFPFTAPPGWGYSLPVVYSIWALVVLALYPLCRWFGALKKRRRDWWLSYL